MVLSVNSSIKSGQARSFINQHETNIVQSIERLSSGLRINSAADDVAGLGIAVRVQSQVTGIQAAVKNTQEGISFAQTGDGALREVEQMLQSMRELVVQSLNTTNNVADRESIQKEIDAMKGAIEANLGRVNYNNNGIFNGDFNNKYFQIGRDSSSALSISINKLDTKQLGSRISLKGTSGVDTSFSLLDTANGAQQLTINGFDIRESNATDDQLSTVDNANSAIAKAAAINASFDLTGVRATVLATRTDQQVTLDAEVGPGVYGNSGSIQAVSLTANTYITINNVDISGFTIQNNDADGKLVSAINAHFDETGVYAQLNSNSELVLIASDGRNIMLDYEGDATGNNLETLIGLRDGNGIAYGGQIMLESDEAVSINFDSDINSFLGDLVGNYGHSSLANFSPNQDQALHKLDVTDASNRQHALNTLDRALAQISDERSFFGALINRFSHTVASLENEKVNLESMKSHIQDTDFGYESARLALNQIRLNASVSMLAQSNVDPALALALVNTSALPQ